MHRFPLPRRSPKLHLAAALRRPPLLSSASVGENDTIARCYSSFLSSDKRVAQQNWKRDAFLGKCYESTAASASVHRFQYKPLERHLKDLIVSRSYSDKDVFIRELISNASDALDKMQLLSVSEPKLLKNKADLNILIETDKDNGIITITDTGIGMTRKELIDCLGTISQSRTANFMKAIQDGLGACDNNLIGQFGVGFFSAFLVSDRVVVSTKSPKSDKWYVWEGEAKANYYTIYEQSSPRELIPSGTHITLYLNRDSKGFAHPEQIEKLVRNYSEFVPFSICIWKEEEYPYEVDEDLAEVKKDEQDEKIGKKKKTFSFMYWDNIKLPQPTWLRNPKEVSKEHYNLMYKALFKDHRDPLTSSHFITEGEVELRSILYVPAFVPSKKDDTIYPRIKNILLCLDTLVMGNNYDGEMVPRYLSFVKGVVESKHQLLDESSKKILQDSRIARIIRKCLVRKAFDMIRGISLSDNKKDYERFWENFGKNLKLGCTEDHENHKRIAPLLRFLSSQSEEKLISLDEYVENMKPDQKDIYYIAAASVSSAKSTPLLEKIAEKDIEVLFLVDPIDELVLQNLKSYKEKYFVDTLSRKLDLGYMNEKREKEAVEAKVVLLIEAGGHRTEKNEERVKEAVVIEPIEAGWW